MSSGEIKSQSRYVEDPDRPFCPVCNVWTIINRKSEPKRYLCPVCHVSATKENFSARALEKANKEKSTVVVPDNRPVCSICGRKTTIKNRTKHGDIIYGCKHCRVYGTERTFHENVRRKLSGEVKIRFRKHSSTLLPERICYRCNKRRATSTGLCKYCSKRFSKPRRFVREITNEERRSYVKRVIPIVFDVIANNGIVKLRPIRGNTLTLLRNRM